MKLLKHAALGCSALLVGLLLAGRAFADAPPGSWLGRVDAFRKAAAAERAKLGLDKNRKKLVSDYPTPEVTFSGPGASPRGDTLLVCAGKPKDFTSKGHVPKTSLIGFEDEHVRVDKLAFTDSSMTGTILAQAGTVPGPVRMHVISPVSSAEPPNVRVFVGCQHVFTVVMSNGDTFFVKADLSGPQLDTSGEWKKASTSLGKVPVQLEVRALGHVDLTLQVTPDENQADAVSDPADEQKQQAVMAKLEACQAQPPEKMAHCMEGPQKELQALAARQAERMQAANAPKHGCATFAVVLKPGGTLSGDGHTCAGGVATVPVTGTWSAP